MSITTPVRKEKIFERPGVRTVRLTIAAGSEVPTHSSNVDVTAVVVRGSGTFVVEGLPIALAPGAVVDMKPNQQHSIAAHDDLELVVLHYRLVGSEAALAPLSCGA